MGEIADGMINGDFDFETGEYLGPGEGFPRTSRNNKTNFYYGNKHKELKGLRKYTSYQHWINSVSHSNRLIIEFGETINATGTLREISIEIQKDFKSFKKFIDTYNK